MTALRKLILNSSFYSKTNECYKSENLKNDKISKIMTKYVK